MMGKSGERMNTIRTKFIVVSLPRTGTKSLCQMAKNVGFEVSHAPGPAFNGFLDRADFIADTPAFQPSRIQYIVEKFDDVKFIYSIKPVDEWIKSMEKTNLANNYNDMYDQYQNNQESMSPHNIVDFESLYEVLGGPFDPTTAVDAYENHSKKLMDIIPSSRLLFYSFQSGWEPLATFLGVTAPNIEIPHLNKDTMFDQIV